MAGCGFEPLYSEPDRGENPSEFLARIDVPPIADRLGQLVRIELTNRLAPRGPAPQPLYSLVVELIESRQDLAVRRDASATRANLIVNASYRLVSRATGETVTSGSIRSINSFDILLEQEFATLAAEADARQRGARDVAERIVHRLAVRQRGAPDLR